MSDLQSTLNAETCGLQPKITVDVRRPVVCISWDSLVSWSCACSAFSDDTSGGEKSPEVAKVSQDSKGAEKGIGGMAVCLL
jgi:hypothetical protein